MQTLIFFLFFLLAAPVSARHLDGNIPIQQWVEDDKPSQHEAEAKEREMRSSSYASYEFVIGKSTGIYVVSISSDGVSKEPMAEFVSSGKFCKWHGGHLWQIVIIKRTMDWEHIKKCRICGKLEDDIDWDLEP